MFTTKDQDNDGAESNCAVRSKGASGGTGVVMQPTSTDYTLVVQLIHRATLQESHGIISGDIDIP